MSDANSGGNPKEEARKKIKRLRWRIFFMFWSLVLGLTLGVLLSGCGDRETGAGGGPNAETTSKTLGTTGQTLDTTEGSGEIEPKGTTVAPDLVSVDNLRPGPVDNNGSPRTFVDFTFNQPTYLTGSNRTSFALVPVSGDDSKYGSDFIPEGDVDPEGDKVVTVLYSGEIEAKDFARGFVSNKAVSSGPQGNAPLNINQTKPLKPNTDSANPDLESAKLDCQEKQVTFTFDEALDQEDVIQNTGGLRVYFEDTKNAGAQAVNQTGDPAVVKGAFIELPEGKELKDAVGVYVTNGTVAGKPQEDKQDKQKEYKKRQKINQLSETHPVELGDSCKDQPSQNEGSASDLTNNREGEQTVPTGIEKTSSKEEDLTNNREDEGGNGQLKQEATSGEAISVEPTSVEMVCDGG